MLTPKLTIDELMDIQGYAKKMEVILQHYPVPLTKFKRPAPAAGLLNCYAPKLPDEFKVQKFLNSISPLDHLLAVMDYFKVAIYVPIKLTVDELATAFACGCYPEIDVRPINFVTAWLRSDSVTMLRLVQTNLEYHKYQDLVFRIVRCQQVNIWDWTHMLMDVKAKPLDLRLMNDKIFSAPTFAAVRFPFLLNTYLKSWWQEGTYESLKLAVPLFTRPRWSIHNHRYCMDQSMNKLIFTMLMLTKRRALPFPKDITLLIISKVFDSFVDDLILTCQVIENEIDRIWALDEQGRKDYLYDQCMDQNARNKKINIIWAVLAEFGYKADCSILLNCHQINKMALSVPGLIKNRQLFERINNDRNGWLTPKIKEALKDLKEQGYRLSDFKHERVKAPSIDHYFDQGFSRE